VLLALFDATNDAMMQQITGAVHPDQPLDRQVDGAVDAYIGNVAAQPALYSSFVRELPGLGQAGSERAQATLERFAQMLVRPGGVQPSRPAGDRRPAADDGLAVIIVGACGSCWSSRSAGRDMRELRVSAGDTIKAILRDRSGALR